VSLTHSALRVLSRPRLSAIPALLALAWLLLGHASRAGAQEKVEPAPLREARFEWDAPRRWLFVSLSFRDVADAAVLRKLRLGLPTTIILTGLLYAQGSDQPLASTLQNCKITWHVWEEMYRVEVNRPEQPAVVRQWSPTLNGVLRRCAQTEHLLVAHSGQVEDDRPLVLKGKVLVNPISPELLQKIQSWISRPSNTAAASPGSILFSTFTGLFMTRIGEAERVLEFSTRPSVPLRSVEAR
jgi:hypothetical protein